MCGAGVVPSRRLFLELCSISCKNGSSIEDVMHFLTRGFTGFNFLGLSKIGKWTTNYFFGSNLFYALMVRDKTNFVGNWQGINVLKSVSTTSPFPQLLTFFSLGNLLGVLRSLLGLLYFRGL